jgi:hypothetical protein
MRARPFFQQEFAEVSLQNDLWGFSGTAIKRNHPSKNADFIMPQDRIQLVLVDSFDFIAGSRIAILSVRRHEALRRH